MLDTSGSSYREARKRQFSDNCVVKLTDMSSGVYLCNIRDIFILKSVLEANQEPMHAFITLTLAQFLRHPIEIN